jgi:hypothetical protein
MRKIESHNDTYPAHITMNTPNAQTTPTAAGTGIMPTEVNPKPKTGKVVFEKPAYGAPGTTSWTNTDGEEHVWA